MHTKAHEGVARVLSKKFWTNSKTVLGSKATPPKLTTKSRQIVQNLRDSGQGEPSPYPKNKNDALLRSQEINVLKKSLMLALALSLSACSIQKMAGEGMLEFTKDTAVPYLMTLDDLQATCATGEAMGAIVASLSRLGLHPQEVAIGTGLSAAMCAQAQQRTAELDKGRALFEGRVSEAQDALIREKNAHRLAAVRLIATYENAVAAYGDLSQACKSFKNPNEGLLSLMGLAAGALAIMHDFSSEKSLAISLDIPRKIEKAAACYDDNEWWGMPSALRASIWLSIPGSGPQGTDPLDVLEKAAKIGDAKGVSLARAMLVQMSAGVGQNERKCNAIQAYDKNKEVSKDFALLNAYGLAMITHQADLEWVKNKGHRCPFGMMACPSEPVSIEMSDDDVDDLLGDLGSDDEQQ